MTLSSNVKAVELVKYFLKLLQYSNIALKTIIGLKTNLELRAPQQYRQHTNDPPLLYKNWAGVESA